MGIAVCRHFTLRLIRGCEAGRIAPMDCSGCSSYDAERIGGRLSDEDRDRQSAWAEHWDAAHLTVNCVSAERQVLIEMGRRAGLDE
jgi:hypothetical protein